MKLNNRYKMKFIQVYAPTSAYDDKDVEATLEFYKIQYSFIAGD